ncbi:MAG TPA: substrate-binding domain-containing protein, partial [Microlunatus sp.]|nr:substrate-binding domain-containing protein [Microlunatus sp.]
VVEGGWSARGGHEALRGLPDDTTVTAVVAANDRVATGVVRAAHERGWRVPDDLSVFGWDDTEMGRFGTPSLSTVAIDRARQGSEAMGRLIAQLRGTEPPPPDRTSLHTVIPRESTGPAPVRP